MGVVAGPYIVQPGQRQDRACDGAPHRPAANTTITRLDYRM